MHQLIGRDKATREGHWQAGRQACSPRSERRWQVGRPAGRCIHDACGSGTHQSDPWGSSPASPVPSPPLCRSGHLISLAFSLTSWMDGATATVDRTWEREKASQPATSCWLLPAPGIIMEYGGFHCKQAKRSGCSSKESSKNSLESQACRVQAWRHEGGNASPCMPSTAPETAPHTHTHTTFCLSSY